MIINHTEILIVGSGIVGLAHALACAKRGKKVLVIEKSLFPIGASIRNFGLIWPIGQPIGNRFERAMKSRSIWLDIIDKTGIYADKSGSLHVVHSADESEIIEEYVQTLREARLDAMFLTPEKTKIVSPKVNGKALLGSMWSPYEITVNPREAITSIAEYLKNTLHVQFEYGVQGMYVNDHSLICSDRIIHFEQAYICSGESFELYSPDKDLLRVKLQMMRTVPQPNQWKLGPAICGGLTLLHYDSFKNISSLQQLKIRIEKEKPLYIKYGIHVLISQHGNGELILGDSHEYGNTLDPFISEEINTLIIKEINRIYLIPELTIDQKWIGIYAKYPGFSEYVKKIHDDITIVNGLGGAGMTLSFGLAEEVVSGTYREDN